MIDLDLFGGPGGWSEASRALGMTSVGIEWDANACATRAAAGHRTIRADITAFPVARLAGRVRGIAGSPECTMFSAAGSRAGAEMLHQLDAMVRDMFASRKTRASHRRFMAAVLAACDWPPPRTRASKHNRKYKTPVRITREQRSATIWKAVRSASLAAEPARFIAACRPEWVALEQVPEVLPLWDVYADELRRMGYSAWAGKLNAADYGVPQTRIRAILIASRVKAVRRPYPTHYDPSRGEQMFGEPWVSMAEALGWGASARPVPTVTAGGVSHGGYEPFGMGARDMLAREQEEGRWVVNPNASGHMRGYRRSMSEPAPSLTGQVQTWTAENVALRMDRQANATVRPGTAPAPAPAIKVGHGAADMRWVLRNSSNDHACERELSEPAGTLFFSRRSNWAAWVAENAAAGSVRISVQEAAVLQSFPADYPWQGPKTRQYQQIGNAWCPLAAVAVLGEATGTDWQPVADRYRKTIMGDCL